MDTPTYLRLPAFTCLYLPARLPACLPSYLPACLPACLPAGLRFLPWCTVDAFILLFRVDVYSYWAISRRWPCEMAHMPGSTHIRTHVQDNDGASNRMTIPSCENIFKQQSFYFVLKNTSFYNWKVDNLLPSTLIISAILNRKKIKYTILWFW